MKQIKAEIVADSLDIRGNRITSYILTYPRFIHGEIMTHRVFSRNSASSRAIPFKKTLELVTKDPFIPYAWQEDHKGMQGAKYISDQDDILGQVDCWLKARDQAVKYASKLNTEGGVTKQLCNRLLEPFMWHTTLVTATEYDNFFELRCPQYEYMSPKLKIDFEKSRIDFKNALGSDSYMDSLNWSLIDWMKINKSPAEIHISLLAEAMWDARNDSKPVLLKEGEWHTPFGDSFDNERLFELAIDLNLLSEGGNDEKGLQLLPVKIATARCARISYLNFEGKDDYYADVKLHDNLAKQKHWSPFEHCATPQSTLEYSNNQYSRNFKGFTQYRSLVDSK